MPDYILEDRLIQRLEISSVDLQRFARKGMIQGVEKNGLVFYSSREFYRLKRALHYMHTEDCETKPMRNTSNKELKKFFS